MKRIILVLMLYCTQLNACYAPKKGFGWNKEELITHSELIVIAELKSIVKTKDGFEYTFNTISTLKGKSVDEIKYSTSTVPNPSTEHFHNHNQDIFWRDESGRSEFPCCICGPDHHFEFDNKYLLFPSSFGARKSAELINTEDDSWLKYVKEEIKNKV